MPNLSNYPSLVTSSIDIRPSRLEEKDLALLQNGQQTVVFGQTTKDVVEIFVYDSSGNIVGHINLRPGDAELSLTTRVAPESQETFLNVDLASALSKIPEVIPGRYFMTMNFFRDEVGSEDSYKLYITDISPSRTELRLKPVAVSSNVVQDIFEFATPSVTKEYAQALIDQVFRMSTNFTDANSLTFDKILDELDIIDPNIRTKISSAGLLSIFNNFVVNMLPSIRNTTLDLLANNVQDLQIQESELQALVTTAVQSVLINAINNGLTDKHFNFV